MKKIFKSLIYLTCLAASLSQDVKAQNMQQWVPDPTVGIHYLTGINGNFTRMLKHLSGESIQVLLVLQRTGNATLSFSLEIPELPKEIRGTWELRNGKVYIALENKWMIQAEAVSRVSRSQTSLNPQMITSLYLQSNLAPSFLLGNYFGGDVMNFSPERLVKGALTNYINPQNIIPSLSSYKENKNIPAKTVTVNDLENQGDSLDTEIGRLRAQLAVAKQEKEEKEKSERKAAEENKKKMVEPGRVVGGKNSSRDDSKIEGKRTEGRSSQEPAKADPSAKQEPAKPKPTAKYTTDL